MKGLQFKEEQQTYFSFFVFVFVVQESKTK